jgi:hypothetical protein
VKSLRSALVRANNNAVVVENKALSAFYRPIARMSAKGAYFFDMRPPRQSKNVLTFSFQR